MITLAIETSNPSVSAPLGRDGGSAPKGLSPQAWLEGPGVAVGELVDVTDDNPLGVRVLATARLSEAPAREPGPVKARNEDRLMVAVDEAMKAAGLAPRHLKRIAVSVGPGGYTSVRLAVTTAKCIAEVTGAQCVGVPTTLVAAVVRAARGAKGAFGVALASKGSDAFVQAFDNLGNSLGDGALLDAPGLEALRQRHAIEALLCDQFLPEAMRAHALAAGLSLEALVLDPVGCLAASRGLTGVDPVSLVPLYPREPEAVTKWRTMHGTKKA